MNMKNIKGTDDEKLLEVEEKVFELLKEAQLCAKCAQNVIQARGYEISVGYLMIILNKIEEVKTVGNLEDSLNRLYRGITDDNEL